MNFKKAINASLALVEKDYVISIQLCFPIPRQSKTSSISRCQILLAAQFHAGTRVPPPTETQRWPKPGRVNALKGRFTQITKKILSLLHFMVSTHADSFYFVFPGCEISTPEISAAARAQWR